MRLFVIFRGAIDVLPSFSRNKLRVPIAENHVRSRHAVAIEGVRRILVIDPVVNLQAVHYGEDSRWARRRARSVVDVSVGLNRLQGLSRKFSGPQVIAVPETEHLDRKSTR